MNARPTPATIAEIATDHGGSIRAAIDGDKCAVWQALLLCTSLLAACATTESDFRRAAQIAQPVRLTPREFPSPEFPILGFVRITRPGAPLVVYLEGDGHAWLSRTEISPNPTPEDPLALRLAALDPSANVAWLARPCQYLLEKSPACVPAYWTGKRYAPEIVEAVNRALSELMAEVRPSRLDLVGYSGGGALAVLLAARRTDVTTIRTVAGNLDIRRFAALHDVSPLTGSLDPAEAGAKIRHLPQLHWVGGKDQVVPREIAESYLQRAGHPACAEIRVVATAGHRDGWEAAGKNLAAAWPSCNRGG